MSAIGPKQTSLAALHMSAFGVKQIFQGKSRHRPDRVECPLLAQRTSLMSQVDIPAPPFGRGLATRSLGSTPDHKGPMLILIQNAGDL